MLVTLMFGLLASAPAKAQPPEVPSSAYGEGAVDGENPRVESRLVVDTEQVAPGESMRVGVVFSMDPDWHIYWRNSGQAGMSTEVAWAGEGLSFGNLQWPAPHAYAQKGEVFTFGYGEQVMLFTEAEVAESAAGEVTVEASVDYLACKVDCIPGSAELSQTVEVADKTKLVGAYRKQLFDRYAARVPRMPKEAGIGVDVKYSQTPIRPGDTFRAAIGLDFCRGGPNTCKSYEVVGKVERYRFIPDATTQVSWKTEAVYRHPSAKAGRVLALEGEASPNRPDDGERLSGVVWLKRTGGDGDRPEQFALLIDQSIPRGKSDATVEQHEPDLLAMREAAGSSEAVGGEQDSADAGSDGGSGPGREGMGFLEAILFAFLGGIILNLMPCVFPVLALKVTSFAELVHEDRSHKIWHGLAYTAGIVVSMLALAGAVLGLRAAGTTVGWGFQFQNPIFPAILAAVVVVFALNLFGVFEIYVESSNLADATRKATGVRRSAAEGVLAVVLATPCSAPFLGTAVGFALTASPATILAIFAMIGFGLAAPFVVFAMVPGWASVLPKPGDWMVYVKKFLGFTLLGVAIWLTWIVGRTTGVGGMMQLLVMLAVIGFATWTYGEWQGSRSLWASGAVVLVFGAAAATSVWALDFPEAPEATPSGAETSSSTSEGAIDWKPWSEKRVDKLLEQGKPVFVDFTADWCITCKVNERTVLSTDTVVEAFEKHDVATLKADWTDGDERITKKLREFGKGGVPMYLVYSPEKPDEPTMLSEVLTPDKVLGAVERAAGKAGR